MSQDVVIRKDRSQTSDECRLGYFASSDAENGRRGKPSAVKVLLGRTRAKKKSAERRAKRNEWAEGWARRSKVIKWDTARGTKTL